jgi:hypothetical protein
LAPLLFRASPIDPLLHPASAPAGLEKYNNTAPSALVDHRAPSPYPGTFARDISRPSSTSTSTQSSNLALLRLHEYSNTREDHRPLNGAPYSHSLHAQHNYNLSLPALSTLASLASASPSQLRYVQWRFCILPASGYRDRVCYAPVPIRGPTDGMLTWVSATDPSQTMHHTA